MNKKNYLILKTVLFAALTLFFLSMPLWADTLDDAGYGVLVIAVVILIYLTYKNYKQIAIVREEDRAYAPATDATTDEQVSYYKRMFYASLLAFPLLTLIIVIDLNDLESHAVESVSVWAPVSFLYEHFGYWPAVLATPVLGVVVAVLFMKKIKNIQTGE